jgi:hypothetical protein
MVRFNRLGTLFIVVALIAGVMPGVASSPSALAQSTQTVEAAVQETVAGLTGADPASVMVEIVHESGDWTFGTATDAAINVRIFLAHRTDDGFEIAFRYDSEFAGLLARAPAGFPSPEIRASLEGIQLAGDASADLSLPWPVGEFRLITDSFEYPYVSFYPRTYGSTTYPHNLPILAMRGGTIYFPCTGVAMIDHGDGYATFYNHLANSPYAAGQTVARGAQIGVTTNSPTCRSTGNGSTVEIWITRYGQQVDLHGVEIGGYTISTSAGGVNGSFTCWNGNGSSTCTLFSSGDGIANMGVHGANLWPDAKIQADQNIFRQFLISGFPPDTLVSLTWQFPDGSRTSIGTVKTNAGGSVLGIAPDLSTDPGDYARKNVLIAQTGSLIRVTPMPISTSSSFSFSGVSHNYPINRDYATAPGQTVTLHGKGFPDLNGGKVQIIDSLNATYTLSGTIVTDDAGNFDFTFVVPFAAEGAGSFKAVDLNNYAHISIGFYINHQPTMVLDTNRGQGGANVATLRGFLPTTQYTISADQVVLATVTTDANGFVSTPIFIPSRTNYSYIYAKQGATTIVTVRYNFQETKWLSATSAAPGATVHLLGMSVESFWNIEWHNGITWLQLASGGADATGSLDIPFVVPATITPGTVMLLRFRSGGFAQYQSAAITITGGPSAPLVANAGSDQTLTTATTTRSVTVNCSGSTPASSITSYAWSHAGAQIGTSASLTISLPVGIHELVLTVTDNANRVSSDSVIIKITSTAPPSAAFSPTHAAVGETVSFTVNQFPANTSVSVFRPSISGNGDAVATVTTDASGSAQGQFVVPALPGGAPLEFSFSASAAVATATLTIDPLFAMFSANPLIANQTGRIRASGFAGNAPMTLEYQNGASWVPIPLVAPNTTSTGISTSNFTVPNTIPTGMTTFRLTAGTVSQTTTHLVYASIPPTASIGSIATTVSANAPSGYLVNLNGTNSSDSDGTIVSWVWYDNDVQIATGSTAQVWFPVGAHTIKLIVTDNSGATGQATRNLTVNNPAPVANIAAISSSIAANDPQGVQVTLNGSNSSDANGTIASYAWTDNDVAIGSDATLSHWFQVGSHTVKLVVTDSHGATAQTTRTFTVTNPLPIANAGPDQAISVNGSPSTVSVTLDGRQSSDANGPIASYVWTLGGNQIATGANPTVSIPNAPATITLTVTDAHGATRTDTVYIAISGNTPPMVSAQVTGGNIKFTSAAQLQVTLDGAATIDAQDADSAMTFVWTENGIELGRGVTLPVTLQKGTHDIVLTVTDTAGGVGSVTIQAIIADPPIANAGPDQTVTTTGPGTTVNLTGSLSANPGGGTLSYAWYRNGIFVVNGANPGVYLAVGSHTLELRVTHASGQVFTDTVVITVSVSTPQPTAVSIWPIRTTVNNWVTFTVTGFPANSPVTITWYRLTGSSSVVTPDVPAITDASGAVTGRFRVPAVTGGPNQPIVFSSGSVSRTVYFEVAPRIKSNTSPGLRGQNIDFSLRGFAKKETITVRWKTPSGRWVTVGTGTTSNTGSANLAIRVPTWAANGDNSVRAETRSFNQQTNVVWIQGGAPLTLAEEPTPTPEPTATPEPENTPDASATPEPTGPEATTTPETPVDVPVETPVVDEPVVTPEPTPEETPAPETPTPGPDLAEPEPTPLPEPTPTPGAEQSG